MSLQTQHDPKNESEIAYWNSTGGRRWVERKRSQDIVLDPILQATLERAQLRRGERVVDIGCGTGASSIALAERAGPSGQVLDVDVSAPMLARCCGWSMVGGTSLELDTHPARNVASHNPHRCDQPHPTPNGGTAAIARAAGRICPLHEAGTD